MSDSKVEASAPKAGETHLLLFFEKIGLFVDNLNLVGGYLSGVCIFFISLIVTYDVVCRFVFNAPTIWALELSTYLCVASLFLAGGYLDSNQGYRTFREVLRGEDRRNQFCY